MNADSRDDLQSFQVNLTGVVDLLSKHIYSSPRVYLRELLQNGRDALAARAELDGADASRGIRITPLSEHNDTFQFQDDGVGLTADEMTELLSTVGRSSKRDIFDLPRSDYLGQFGIGLLSCFMVADQIVIQSRSARGSAPVEWIGNSDGTFSVRELEGDLPIGTTVSLKPRFDQHDLLSTPTVLALARTFAEFLPVGVRVDLPGGGTETVTHEAPFLEAHTASASDLLRYGSELLGVEPFAAIPLSVPGTNTTGVAYVLPSSPPPGARQANRVYLGRMLLSENVDALVPDWAFFVRVVLNSTALTPTASRESLVDDDILEHTRTAIGTVLRQWVLEMAARHPAQLNDFVQIHALALKSLVIYDEELAKFITPWLSVETTLGRMTIESLTRDHTQLRYAETVDEFRQIASIASPDRPVINGGYIYDTEIARMLPTIVDGLTVDRVSVLDELDFLEVPPLEVRSVVAKLEDRASAVLADADCAVIVRGVPAADVTGLYLADPEVLRSIDRRSAREISRPGLWKNVLGKMDAFAEDRLASDGTSKSLARLCLNWNNPVVVTLSTLRDDAVFSRTIELLYVQALLTSQRPLSVRDRAMMTNSMSDLIAMSVALGDSLPESSPL
ncbi:HSP90 family protein [Salinibacterium sp. SWN1162]|uniref:HSP90 family protein n=1 Tax=Salinibacterium sp. SWN1162 TaxID=2792053 RepID=UPI0018CF9892|nr:HSP90 family protein [Salinibacterium sp. SWN1162]MBH0008171.1 HSP90 family protein [Salinibacterium sp. SWN1162]